MTLDDVKNSNKSSLTISDICKVVGIRPDKLRYQALTDASKLGFPVCIAGNTVRVPRAGFLAWFEGINLSYQEGLEGLK